MVSISKEGQTIIINVDGTVRYFPSSMICAHADKGSDSVDIKLKATRKTVVSFSYKSVVPQQESATATVEYIASLV